MDNDTERSSEAIRFVRTALLETIQNDEMPENLALALVRGIRVPYLCAQQ